MRALIIDDSRAMRSVLSRIMTEVGFAETVHAGHGQEGLERLGDSGAFDVVLVDWNMPVMNGLEFIRSMRADSRFKDLLCLMVTTESEMSQVARALLAGANEYVMKPFTKEVIVEKLELLGLALTRAN